MLEGCFIIRLIAWHLPVLISPSGAKMWDAKPIPPATDVFFIYSITGFENPRDIDPRTLHPMVRKFLKLPEPDEVKQVG